MAAFRKAFPDGQRVAYSAAFLEATSVSATVVQSGRPGGGWLVGSKAQERGTVLGTDPAWTDMVVVRWDGHEWLSHVNPKNLVRVEDISRDADRNSHHARIAEVAR